MKNNFRKAALSTICMLIVAVMSLTGVTYAWFTQGDTAKVDGMSMKVETASGGLEVSENGTSWGTVLTLNVPKTNVKPVSTVNAQTFVHLDSYDPTDSSKAKFVNDTENVIKQTLYLGNTGTTPLVVDLRNTFVKDIANGSTTTKIADAARIAVFTVDSAGTKTLVGIMNPYFNGTAIVDAAETYNGVKAADAAAANGFVTYANGTFTSELTTVTTNGLEVTIPAAAADGTRGTLQIEVVVWLEGQDAACINANAGGAFEIVLQFNKTDATIANVTQ